MTTPLLRRLRYFAVFSVLALVLAACGGGDDEGTDTTADSGDSDTTMAETTMSDTTMADTTMADTTMSDTTGGSDTTSGEGASLTEMFPDGTVNIGIANEVPYGYEDEEGNPTGEAPEVAKAVLSELGIDNVEATVVEFGTLIPGIQAGQFDMIAAGMFITPERAEQIIFSDPDYCVSEAFAVPEGNPMGITDYQSVIDTGAQIAVLSGAVEEGYALDIGVPDSQLTRFDDVGAQYDALEAGRVDAVTGTALTVNTQVEAREGMEATEGFFPVIDGEEVVGCGGFGFTDQEFRDIFNEKLNELQEDGTVAEIVTSFGFSEADVEKAEELTAEELATP